MRNTSTRKRPRSPWTICRDGTDSRTTIVSDGRYLNFTSKPGEEVMGEPVHLLVARLTITQLTALEAIFNKADRSPKTSER